MQQDRYELYRTILEAFDFSKDGIAVVTLDEERVLYHNKAWNEIHGIELDKDLTGRLLKDIELEDRHQIIEEGKKTLLNEGFYSKQVHVIRRDGVPHDVHILASFIGHMEPPLVVIVLRDVTEIMELAGKLRHEIAERKQVEAALKESEERHRHVTEMTSDFTYSLLVGEDGTIKPDWVGEAVARLSGYTIGELTERGARMGVTYPEDREIVHRHLDASLAGRRNVIEFRIVRKDGTIRWMRDYARPVRERPGGRVFRILGAVQDITGRKRAEEELEQRNAELRVLNDLHRIETTSRDRKTVLKKFLRPLTRFFNAKIGAVYDLDHASRSIVLIATTGIQSAIRKKLRRLSMDDELTKAILESDGVLVSEDDVRDLRSPRDEIKRMLGIKRTIAFIVRSKGRVGSVVFIGSPSDEPITDKTRRFLNLVGDQLGIAVERLELLDSLAEREQELKELTQGLFDSIEAERQLLAVNLHDGMAQTLVALNLDFDVVERRLSTVDEESAWLLGRIRRNLQVLTESTRNISKSLHPTMLDDLGFQPALEWYIDKFVRSEKLRVDLDVIGFDEELSDPLRLTLYRICQEALANVVQHAGAKHVSIKLTKGYPDVIMNIEDDGRGFSVHKMRKQLKGFGIAGMKERVQRLGGTFMIKSYPGKGTRIRVTFPLEE